MMDEKKLKEFIAYAKDRIRKDGKKEEDYCIVVYTNNLVSHIFKRLKDFEKRGLKVVQGIESSGESKIDLTPWEFA